MASDFTIRFSGGDVKPENIPLHELAALLQGAEDAILGIARRDFPKVSEHDLFISLSELKSESLGLGFSGSSTSVATKSYEILTKNLDANALGNLPGLSIDGVRVLTRFSKEHKCETQFWEAHADKPTVVLSSDYEAKVKPLRYIRGETTLYGFVERAGGASPRVKIKLSDSEYIYCDTTSEQARLLGSRLYKEVGLDGTASWDPRDGTLVYFRIQRVNEYDPADAVTAFAELALASGGAVDAIGDLDAYFNDLRAND